jgi:hypothetical protein
LDLTHTCLLPHDNTSLLLSKPFFQRGSAAGSAVLCSTTLFHPTGKSCEGGPSHYVGSLQARNSAKLVVDCPINAADFRPSLLKQPPPAVRASAHRPCRPNLHSPALFSCQQMQKMRSSVRCSTKMARSVGRDALGCASLCPLKRVAAMLTPMPQEKRYRSMQEHIRRAHPDHYIPKLPATEESFQLMISTPPTQRPQVQPGVGIPDHRGPCMLPH